MRKTAYFWVAGLVIMAACRPRDEQAGTAARARTAGTAGAPPPVSTQQASGAELGRAAYALGDVCSAVARFEALLQPQHGADTVKAASNLAIFAVFDPNSIEYNGYPELITKYLRFFNEVPLNKDTYRKLITCYSNAALKAQNPGMVLHIYYWIGQKAWEMRDLDTAIAYLESRGDAAEEDDYARSEYHNNLTLLAHIYGAVEDEEALLRVGATLARSPSYAARYSYYETLTMLYCALGDGRRAKQAAEEAVRAIPGDARFGAEARQLRNQLKNYLAPQFRRAQPEWEHSKARAQFLWRMGRTDEAREVLAKAITELQPQCNP